MSSRWGVHEKRVPQTAGKQKSFIGDLELRGPTSEIRTHSTLDV